MLRRAANNAASLTRFARSAPTIPVVVRASASKSTSGPSGTLRVDLQYRQATVPVGTIYRDPTIKTSWSQKSLVESIRAVGSCQHNHGLPRIKAVHLDQQLVERLLALIIGIDAGP